MYQGERGKKEMACSFAVRLGRAVVPSHALATAPLLVLLVLLLLVAAAAGDAAAAGALAAALLLVQRAQRLAPEHEVLVLDDDGPDPGVRAEVGLAHVRNDVVCGGGGGDRRGRRGG